MTTPQKLIINSLPMGVKKSLTQVSLTYEGPLGAFYLGSITVATPLWATLRAELEAYQALSATLTALRTAGSKFISALRDGDCPCCGAPCDELCSDECEFYNFRIAVGLASRVSTRIEIELR